MKRKKRWAHAAGQSMITCRDKGAAAKRTTVTVCAQQPLLHHNAQAAGRWLRRQAKGSILLRPRECVIQRIWFPPLASAPVLEGHRWHLAGAILPSVRLLQGASWAAYLRPPNSTRIVPRRPPTSSPARGGNAHDGKPMNCTGLGMLELSNGSRTTDLHVVRME
jgi:hypothetical protein